MRLAIAVIRGILLFLLLPVAAASAQDRPLVFIPGIIGSELVDTSGKVVWGDFLSLRNLAQLTVRDGPSDPSDNFKATRIIGAVTVLGPIQIRQYQILRDALKNLGYREGVNYFEFPYDWRQSNFTTAQQFAAFVSANPILNNSGGFDIVAHSMGGLVAEIYVKEWDQRKLVRRLVNLAVPFAGSAATFTTLTDGWGTPANWIAGGLPTIQRFLLSMPSFYELLPRYQNCCILGIPSDPNRRPYNPLTTEGWDRIDWRLGAVDSAKLHVALDSAVRLRDLADRPYPSYVDVYYLVGSAVETNWIYYVDPAARRIVQYTPGLGDGTVPQGSAAGGNLARAFVSLAQHSTIFADAAAQETIKRVLLPGPVTPERYNSVLPVAITQLNEVLAIGSIGIEVSQWVVGPLEQVTVSVRVTGESGAPLDQLQISAFAEDSSSVKTPIRLSGAPANDRQAVYTGSFVTGQAAGPVAIAVTARGIPTLYGFLTVLVPQ